MHGVTGWRMSSRSSQWSCAYTRTCPHSATYRLSRNEIVTAAASRQVQPCAKHEVRLRKHSSTSIYLIDRCAGHCKRWLVSQRRASGQDTDCAFSSRVLSLITTQLSAALYCAKGITFCREGEGSSTEES